MDVPPDIEIALVVIDLSLGDLVYVSAVMAFGIGLRWPADVASIAVMASGDLSGCVIVSGMPGAGKSTVGALAAGLLPRAALVKGDDVNLMIRSGGVWFRGEPRLEADRQYELCKRNMCALANNFVDYGFVVFIDTVVQDRAMLDLLLALLSPRPARLVILAPGSDVCRQRNMMRAPIERFAFDGYEQLDTDMRRDFADDAWWFDTSSLTPADTAEQLVRETTERARPLTGSWNAAARAT